MERVETAGALRAAVARHRREGARIGFVPTMGNLHEGHLSLVDEAKRRAARVVASVFVNPTQFGPNEDYARYPRTLEADAAALAARGCDLLFAPSVDAMYPNGVRDAVRVEVPALTGVLEGELRPGHFDGVASVVTRLFNLVQPDVAVFGRKDYQQLLVVRRLVEDLSIPVEVVGVATAREPHGLAMSSRNQYLDAGQRERAGAIHATLQRMAAAAREHVAIATIERDARGALESEGFAVEYAVIRSAADLAPVASGEPRIALVAARLGTTRLIDNLLIDRDLVD